MDSKIAIFVATHVKFNPPSNPIYIPLQVGRELHDDLGYIGDNIGEHISDMNPLFGELTGLYWIWQNIHDMDYVGLCHYRRYFLNSSGQACNRDDFLGKLSEYDVLMSEHGTTSYLSYYEHYGRAHNINDLYAVENAVAKLYPDDLSVFKEIMNGTLFYTGNLFVTSLNILKSYSEWLFNIFAEASEYIDVSSYDSYHARVYGFLSEQLLYVFCKSRGLTFTELPVGISQEKAETAELKTELKKLISEGKKAEASQLLNEALNNRPDLLLPGSDVFGELKTIADALA